MASSLQESASFPPHRRNLQTIGSVAGNANRTTVRRHWFLGDGFANLLGAGKGKSRFAVVKDYQELLAAIPSDEIIRPHGTKQPLGCLPQDVITSDVAVGIVHALEEIQ